jgi:hypothetical protein
MNNMFVIRRNSDGCYVTNGPKSYTKTLTNALVFSSREAAESYGVCGNESIVPLTHVLNLY